MSEIRQVRDELQAWLGHQRLTVRAAGANVLCGLNAALLAREPHRVLRINLAEAVAELERVTERH